MFLSCFSTLQICEQINEKKSVHGIEFLVFFSHNEVSFYEECFNPYLFVYTLKKTPTQIRVRYAETDQMGVVYHGNYAQYLEQGRTEWLRNTGFSYKWMEENGIHLPVTQLSINYKAPAKYDDELTVVTSLKKIPIYRIEFYYEIYNQNDALLVTAETTLVFLNSLTKKLTKAPKYLLDKLED